MQSHSVKSSESLTNKGLRNTFSFSNRIYILNFDQSFQILFQHLSEESLQFTASKVLKHGFPIRRVLKLTKVWSHITAKNTQSCRFANTILPHKSQNLTWTRSGQSMKLKRVRSIPMRSLWLKTFGQIDDSNSFERTESDTHTATDT